MMLGRDEKYAAKIAETVEAIEHAFAGKPHPLILTPEQRYWRFIASRTAFYPRQPIDRAVPAPAAEPQLPSQKDIHGYGEGRYMGD